MSLENDIKYYKKGNMTNETLILQYGNRCSGKEYKEQIRMNDAKREMLAKKNSCRPDQVSCLNCYYKWNERNYCNYHKCGLINFDEPCYKFQFVIK